MLKLPNGHDFFDVVEALSPTKEVIRLGVPRLKREKLGLFTEIAQYLGLVKDGLICAEHLFQGLNRGLFFEGDMNAGDRVNVYSWKPTRDLVWKGDPYYGTVVQLPPPEGKVLVVVVGMFEKPIEFPGFGMIAGSVERWNFVKGEPPSSRSYRPGAPINWKDRYRKLVWSRGK